MKKLNDNYFLTFKQFQMLKEEFKQTGTISILEHDGTTVFDLLNQNVDSTLSETTNFSLQKTQNELQSWWTKLNTGVPAEGITELRNIIVGNVEELVKQFNVDKSLLTEDIKVQGVSLILNIINESILNSIPQNLKNNVPLDIKKLKLISDNINNKIKELSNIELDVNSDDFVTKEDFTKKGINTFAIINSYKSLGVAYNTLISYLDVLENGIDTQKTFWGKYAGYFIAAVIAAIIALVFSLLSKYIVEFVRYIGKTPTWDAVEKFTYNKFGTIVPGRESVSAFFNTAASNPYVQGFVLSAIGVSAILIGGKVINQLISGESDKMLMLQSINNLGSSIVMVNRVEDLHTKVIEAYNTFEPHGSINSFVDYVKNGEYNKTYFNTFNSLVRSMVEYMPTKDVLDIKSYGDIPSKNAPKEFIFDIYQNFNEGYHNSIITGVDLEKDVYDVYTNKQNLLINQIGGLCYIAHTITLLGLPNIVPGLNIKPLKSPNNITQIETPELVIPKMLDTKIPNIPPNIPPKKIPDINEEQYNIIITYGKQFDLNLTGVSFKHGATDIINSDKLIKGITELSKNGFFKNKYVAVVCTADRTGYGKGLNTEEQKTYNKQYDTYNVDLSDKRAKAVAKLIKSVDGTIQIGASGIGSQQAYYTIDNTPEIEYNNWQNVKKDVNKKQEIANKLMGDRQVRIIIEDTKELLDTAINSLDIKKMATVDNIKTIKQFDVGDNGFENKILELTKSGNSIISAQQETVKK